MVGGMLVSNGTFNVSRMSSDILTSTGDVMMLIGMALIAAVALGIIYAIYLILKGG